MKTVKQFAFDFLGTFLYFASSLIFLLTDITFNTFTTIKRFFKGVIRPMFVELLADINIILLVFMSMYYDFASKTCLLISKYLLKYSSFCNNRSEEITERTWAK